MARTPFRVEVLTPEGSVFDDEVELVSTRTEVGSIGIMARHQPLLGLLVPTELRLYKSETDIVSYAQGEGYVQVSDGGRARARRGGPRARASSTRRTCATSCARPRTRYAAAEPHTEEQRRAGRDKRRWDAFLRIAEGKLRQAEDALSTAEENTEAHRRAGRDQRRWSAFLKIAEGG